MPTGPHEYEPVYIVMSRGLLPNWQDKTFTTIWPLPAHLQISTGTAASSSSHSGGRR